MAVTVRCSACGSPVIAGAKSCSGCGLQLSAQAVAVRDPQRRPLLTIPRILIMAAAILVLALFIQTQWDEQHAVSAHEAFRQKLAANTVTAEDFIANCGQPRLRQTGDGKITLVYDIDALTSVDVRFSSDGTRSYVLDAAHVSRTGKVTGGRSEIQESQALAHLPQECGR